MIDNDPVPKKTSVWELPLYDFELPIVSEIWDDTNLNTAIAIKVINNKFGAQIANAVVDSDPGLVLTRQIPALGELVYCPVPCLRLENCRYHLRTIIIHLNDHHEWSRKEIADWLDSLDLDLSFPVEADHG